MGLASEDWPVLRQTGISHTWFQSLKTLMPGPFFGPGETTAKAPTHWHFSCQRSTHQKAVFFDKRRGRL